MRFGWVLLMVVSLVAGCSRSVPPPPPGGVKVLAREVHVNAPSTFDLAGADPVAAGDVVRLGSESVVISWFLDGSGSPDMVRELGAPEYKVYHTDRLIRVWFPPGGPSVWEVWLEGASPSRVTVRRQVEPTVTVGVVGKDGKVTPLVGDLTLPPGPVTLDLTFSVAPDPATLQSFIDGTLDRSMNEKGRLGKATWLSPTHLRWEVRYLPGELKLATHLFMTGGQRFAGSRFVIRNAEPDPVVERIHVASGQVSRLAALPTPVMEAELSPDRKWLWALTYNPEDRSPLHVVDLATGRSLQLPAVVQHVWSPRGELLAFPGVWEENLGWYRWRPSAAGFAEQPGKIRTTSVSPDGRKAAYLRLQRYSRDRDDNPLPNDLVIVELETGQEQVVENFSRHWWLPKEGDYRQWVAWSPDGKRIAATEPSSLNGAQGLLVYDLTTGKRELVRSTIPDLAGQAGRLFWSPDGSRLLRGNQVFPLSSGPTVTVPGWGLQRLWAPDSRRVLTSLREWDTVILYDIFSGAQAEFGPGHPLGFDGQYLWLIRWPASGTRPIIGM